jgi:hypothetical protein
MNPRALAMESLRHIHGRCAVSMMPPHGNRDCATDMNVATMHSLASPLDHEMSTRAVWSILLATCISTNATVLDRSTVMQVKRRIATTGLTTHNLF